MERSGYEEIEIQFRNLSGGTDENREETESE
jgi:hypothetical protein